MGGLGSGTWARDDWSKKTAVEQCHILDVNELAHGGKLHVGQAGTYHWDDPCGGHPFSLKFAIVPDDHCRPVLVIFYRCDSEENDLEDVSLPIRLQPTYPAFGGVRWWFTCPMVIDDLPCVRRVGKLYLPPGARYFGCRHCQGLVYRREPDPFEHAARFLEIRRKRIERLRHVSGR